MQTHRLTFALGGGVLMTPLLIGLLHHCILLRRQPWELYHEYQFFVLWLDRLVYTHLTSILVVCFTMANRATFQWCDQNFYLHFVKRGEGCLEVRFIFSLFFSTSRGSFVHLRGGCCSGRYMRDGIEEQYRLLIAPWIN